MHARFCSPVTGRFLSVDPVLQVEQALQTPQLWNRYSYALSNPLAYTDPTGETVYLVTYTTGNRSGDEDFKRAAETYAADIRSGKGFDPKKDTVLVRGVKTKDDFRAAIKEANSLEASFGKVGEVSLFSHAGPNDGPAFNGANGQEFFTVPELRAGLGINWEAGGCARFYACKTAPRFASRFAATQGVPAYGFNSYTYFSASPDRRTPVQATGPVYMIQAQGRARGGYWAGVRANLGSPPAEPMSRRDP
jgi:hypothetical protein